MKQPKPAPRKVNGGTGGTAKPPRGTPTTCKTDGVGSGGWGSARGTDQADKGAHHTRKAVYHSHGGLLCGGVTPWPPLPPPPASLAGTPS